MTTYARNCGTCKYFDVFEGYLLGNCDHPNQIEDQDGLKIVKESEKCFLYELKEAE